MNERYAWGGGEELLHFRPGTGTGTSPDPDSVIAALPPFEEANRTRTLIATMLRDLNRRGFTTALPDLPGQGESPLATEAARLTDWQDAFAAATAALPGRVHVIAVRAGALLDAAAEPASRWYLSPQSGAALARELTRLTAPDGTVAGNRLHPDFLATLQGAEPATVGPLRTIRLVTEAQPADRVVDAAPLWRRAEPDNDPALAALLADDIADWIGRCAA